MEILIIVIYFVFLLASLLVPDIYIPQIINYLNGAKKEEKFFSHRQMLGWVERFLYFLFLVFFINQFALLLGIWLGLKTVIILKDLEGETASAKKSKTKFTTFLVGNGLSIISVILLFFFAKAILGF